MALFSMSAFRWRDESDEDLGSGMPVCELLSLSTPGGMHLSSYNIHNETISPEGRPIVRSFDAVRVRARSEGEAVRPGS